MSAEERQIHVTNNETCFKHAVKPRLQAPNLAFFLKSINETKENCFPCASTYHRRKLRNMRDSPLLLSPQQWPDLALCHVNQSANDLSSFQRHVRKELIANIFLVDQCRLDAKFLVNTFTGADVMRTRSLLSPLSPLARCGTCWSQTKGTLLMLVSNTSNERPQSYRESFTRL